MSININGCMSLQTPPFTPWKTLMKIIIRALRRAQYRDPPIRMSNLRDEFMSDRDLAILDDSEDLISFSISQFEDYISISDCSNHQLQAANHEHAQKENNKKLSFDPPNLIQFEDYISISGCDNHQLQDLNNEPVQNEDRKKLLTCDTLTCTKHVTMKICEPTEENTDTSMTFDVHMDQNNYITFEPNSFSSMKISDNSLSIFENYTAANIKKKHIIPPSSIFRDNRNANFKTYSLDLEKQRIANLIHQLILEKYMDNLLNIKQRSLQHHNLLKKSSVFEQNANEYALDDSTTYKLKKVSTNQCTKTEITTRQNNDESIDSGLNSSKNDNENKTEFVSQENSNVVMKDYNSHTFLEEPTRDQIFDVNCPEYISEGDETHYYSIVSSDLMEQPTERSIDTSNISTLLSSTGTRRHSEAIYSLYSTVNKTSKKNSSTKKNKPFNKSYLLNSISGSNESDYESIDELKIQSKEKEIIKEVAIYLETIHQISKALTILKNRPYLFEQDIRIEAEKILLMSTVKRDQLNQELMHITAESSSPISISLTVENIKFKIKPGMELNKAYNWYFLCIARTKSTVKVSGILKELNGNIEFPEGFKFEGILSDTEISISVYGLSLRTKIKNKLLKWKKNQSCHCCLDAKSGFKLWGYSEIHNLKSVENCCIKFSNMSKESLIQNHFTADIKSTIKINIKKKGFLTIGTDYKGSPVWNRRWCVLDGTNLQYWDYPNDNVAPPIGVLDLTKSLMHETKIVDRNICARPKTLLLELKLDTLNETRQYLLSTDSKLELEEWQKQLNFVLQVLKREGVHSLITY